MLPVLLTAVIVWGLPTLYLAYRSREFRKFLAGAFFVSSGIQFYLYLVLCLYFGFFAKPKAPTGGA
jgi:hypothetical protein